MYYGQLFGIILLPQTYTKASKATAHLICMKQRITGIHSFWNVEYREHILTEQIYFIQAVAMDSNEDSKNGHQ